MQDRTLNCWSIHHSSYTTQPTPLIIHHSSYTPLVVAKIQPSTLLWAADPAGGTHLTHVESRGSKVRSACVWLEDAHVGENVDTPIGQFVLIGNFRRRLARELLVWLSKLLSPQTRWCFFLRIDMLVAFPHKRQITYQLNQFPANQAKHVISFPRSAASKTNQSIQPFAHLQERLSDLIGPYWGTYGIQ